MRRFRVRILLAVAIAAGIALSLLLAYRAAARRHMWVWLPTYLLQATRGHARSAPAPIHVLVLFTDHFEPKAYGPDSARERERMARWLTAYPALADGHRDADGRPPQHTFFYPYDEFEDWTMLALNRLTFAGYGEVELHLHHTGDTEETLRRKLEDAKALFGSYGALVEFTQEPKSRYGFIHGNWALDNSEMESDLCGVNRELDVLRETGCYADFTFPAAHQAEQPRLVNSIFYAVDDPQPKSYDAGTPAAVGAPPPPNSLLLVQGVLGLRGKRGPFNLIPGIEVSGNFYWSSPPTPDRADYWIKTGVHVKGRPEWVFVKLHCHGAEESEMVSFFDGPMDELFTYLESRYNDGAKYVLHYVTAREAYNIIKAAEAGKEGNPDRYRDFVLPSPANSYIRSTGRYRLLSGGSSIDAEILEDDVVGLDFHTGPVSQLRGRLARVQLDPGRAALTVRTPLEPVELETRVAPVRVSGAELQELEQEAELSHYVLSPHAPTVEIVFEATHAGQ